MQTTIESYQTQRGNYRAQVVQYYDKHSHRDVIYTTPGSYHREGLAECAACEWQNSREGRARLRLLPALAATVDAA